MGFLTTHLFKGDCHDGIPFVHVTWPCTIVKTPLQAKNLVKRERHEQLFRDQ